MYSPYNWLVTLLPVPKSSGQALTVSVVTAALAETYGYFEATVLKRLGYSGFVPKYPLHV
jgi:hypothetical protein